MDIITRQNYQLIDELNELLKETSVEKRFTLRQIDDGYDIGVVVGIPPLFDKTKNHYYLSIKESKHIIMTLNQTIININNEVGDLLKTIKPDILTLLNDKKYTEEKLDEIKIDKDYFKIYIHIK